MKLEQITTDVDRFVRESFAVGVDDPGYHRDVDLFEAGYVDSVGLVEILAFVDSRFAVEIAEEDLLSDDFSTVSGIARIVDRTRSNLSSGAELRSATCSEERSR